MKVFHRAPRSNSTSSHRIGAVTDANLLSEERSVQELREPLSVDTVAATPRALPGAPPVAEQFTTSDRSTRRLTHLVPDRMEEVYRWAQPGRMLTVTARYENFRRLDVRTQEKPQARAVEWGRSDFGLDLP
jgi:hypothetical protein